MKGSSTMKLRINESDIFDLPKEEIYVISEETGEILQKFKAQQPIDYYINLVKKKIIILTILKVINIIIS